MVKVDDGEGQSEKNNFVKSHDRIEDTGGDEDEGK